MSFQQLVDTCETDPALAEAMKASESIEGICSIALQFGITVTPEEVIKGAAAATSELSDADLAGVAGGSWTGNEGADTAASTVGGFVAASTVMPIVGTIFLIK